MRQIILIFLATLLFCQSCSVQQAESSPTPKTEVVPGNIAKETPTEMPTPSVIIDPMRQRGNTVSVTIGDVFAVALPQGSSKWKVDYSSVVFQPLTPPENMEEPGPQGWLFRAMEAGRADIRLTASAAECDQPPCPPAPPITYVFTVEVK